MKILICFPLLVIFSLGGCKKPTTESTLDYHSVPPIVLSASLRDSIPSKMVKALNLDDVTGIKIQYITGLHTSYFEYEADQNALLQTISQLPFSMRAAVGDIACHRITFQDLNLIKQKISTVELENSSSFWTTEQTDFDSYECIKPPFKHTILFHKNSRRILHRIEFFG